MDFDYFSAFAIPFFFLRRLGMWQKKSSSWLYRFYGLLLHLAVMEQSSSRHTVFLYKTFMTGSVKDFSEVLNILFSMYGNIVKSVWFFLNLGKVSEMLKELARLLEFTSFGRSGQRPQLEAQIKGVLKVSKLYYASALSAILLTGISVLVRFKDRRLPFNTWLPYDYKLTDEIFWFTAIFQIVFALIGCAINFSFDIIPVVFIRLTSALLDELLMEIASIKNEDGLEKLQQCIECHIRIKKFIKDISRHLSFPFLLQTFCSTVILCTSAFLLTTVRKFKASC